jgi:hypothetical protein
MVCGSLQVLRLLSTTKTGHHDIAESGVKHPKNQSINQPYQNVVVKTNNNNKKKN